MGKDKFGDDFERDAVHPLSGSGLLTNHEKKITVRGVSGYGGFSETWC